MNFASTHWSVVLAAGDATSPQAEGALLELCRAYWYPLYAYVRREGYDAHEAQDLTQDFFARLIEKNFLKSADQDKGRFRSFLLVALKRFLINEWHRAHRLKRGGDREIIPLDTATAEGRYHLEPVDEMTAERIYERQWALALLDRVLKRLSDEASKAGKTRQFELLKPFLYGESSALGQSEIASRLNLSLGGVKSAVHRLRQRYRESLREEVAQTVSSPEEVEEELRHLLRILRQ